MEIKTFEELWYRVDYLRNHFHELTEEEIKEFDYLYNYIHGKR